jgi:CRP/FNR family transcriptional regulator
LPAELEGDALDHVDGRLATLRRKARQGEVLFRAGDKFESLFVVWTGFFKTVATTLQGRNQVAGFVMPGDLIGVEGIDDGRHAVEAVALRDSQVCVIPYVGFQTLARDAPSLLQRLLQLMSRKIVNDHRAMLHLGSMRADERIAAFVLDWSERMGARGHSGSLLVLPMGRAEIGSYLGLTPESVSRAFSNLQSAGLLKVSLRQVRIVDVVGLRQVVDGTV